MRVGIIGTGKWGLNLVRAFSRLDSCRVTHLCDITPAQMGRACALAPQAKSTSDFRELTDSDQVDAVVVATPPRTHFEIARAALLSRKPVFVEKPLTLDLAEAQELARISTELTVPVMVGHLMVYHPAVRRARELVSTGALGRIEYVVSDRANYQTGTDSTALWDFAPHDLSMICSVLGEMPCRVRATGAAGAEANENAVFLWSGFKSGVCAHSHLSWREPVKTRRLTIVGTDAALTFDDLATKDRLIVHKLNGRPSPTATRVSYDENAEPLMLECEHFVKALAQGSECETGIRHALAITRLIAAAAQSLRDGGSRMETNFQ